MEKLIFHASNIYVHVRAMLVFVLYVLLKSQENQTNFIVEMKSLKLEFAHFSYAK